jgi:hypothetical protein
VSPCNNVRPARTVAEATGCGAIGTWTEFAILHNRLARRRSQSDFISPSYVLKSGSFRRLLRLGCAGRAFPKTRSCQGHQDSSWFRANSRRLFGARLRILLEALVRGQRCRVRWPIEHLDPDFWFVWGRETLSKRSETGPLTADLESTGWGGKRAGAGRPVGIPETQPRGLCKARRLCRLRVPADATPYERDLAQQALDAIVSVMNGEVPAEQQSGVLRAAIHLREELLGKPSQRLDLEGKGGFSLNVTVAPPRPKLPENSDGDNGPALEPGIETPAARAMNGSAILTGNTETA